MRNGEYASGEVPSYGHEIQHRAAAGLQLPERHADLGKMLMGEWLIDRYIVAAPAEMCGRSGMHSSSGAAGERRDVDLPGGEKSC